MVELFYWHRLSGFGLLCDRLTSRDIRTDRAPDPMEAEKDHVLLFLSRLQVRGSCSRVEDQTKLTPCSVVGAGIGRTYWLVQLGIRPDTSWTGGYLLVWCIAEMQLAIVCACAPSIRLICISAYQHSANHSRQYRKRNDSEQSPVKSEENFVAIASVRSAQTIYISYQPEVEPKTLA